MENSEYIYGLLQELLEAALDTKSILNVSIREPNKVEIYFIPNPEYPNIDDE